MTVNAEPLQAWKGRSETAHDQVTAAPLRMLRATLDLPPAEAVAMAVQKSERLPPDVDGRVSPVLIISFTPR